MKKIKTLFLVMVLCIFACGMTVSAAETPSLTVSSAEAAQGSEVQVIVSIANNPGIAMLEMPVSYDETRLELISGTPEGLPNGMFGTTGVWIGTGDSTYTGTILTLNFKVKDDAPLGDAFVNVSVRSAANWDEEPVAFGVTNGKVTVTLKAHEHVCTETTPATCTTPGLKSCTVDGCTYTEEIPALGHSYGAWTVTQNPTCVAAGSQNRTCSVCGHVDTVVINATGHAMAVRSDAAGHWSTCGKCGYSTAKEAHNAGADGKCTVCGYQVVVETPKLDDVPKTGDITPMLTMISVIMMIAAFGTVFMFARKKTR